MSQAFPQRIHYGFISSGFLLLLGSSYLDNARGPLLPAIAQELGLPWESMGLFLTVGNMASLVTTLLLMPLMNRISERNVTLLVCGFAFLVGLGSLAVESFASLILLGVAIGWSVSTMGAMCNILTIRGTPEVMRSRMLSASHVMYGLGSFLAPLLTTAVLAGGLRWAWAMVGGGGFLLMVGLLVLAKVPNMQPEPGVTQQRSRINGFQLLIVVLFAVYVGAENLTSTWLVPYVTEVYPGRSAEGPRIMMGFFLVLAASRLFCFVVARPAIEKYLIAGSLVIPALCFSIGYFGGNPWVFAGMGLMGPFFPMLLGRLSRSYPDQWRSLTIWLIFGMQVFMAILNVSIGKVGDVWGMRWAYLIPFGILMVALVLLVAYLRYEPRPEGVQG